MRPRVGITADILPAVNGHDRYASTLGYSDAVAHAGGTPLLLPCVNTQAISVPDLLHTLDALILTGGDDPDMTPYGIATHPSAVVMHPQRQAYETALLQSVHRDRPDLPVLGVCWGMQLMALEAGGTLNQHLPDTLGSDAQLHQGNQLHDIKVASSPNLLPQGLGRVLSNHHQAVHDPGHLTVAARAADQTVEAVIDPSRPFYMGVQWHAERMTDRLAPLGIDLIAHLVAHAAGH